MISSGCLLLVHLICTVLVFISPAHLAPMPDQYSRGVDWLSRYGYLPPPDPRTGQLQTKEGIEKAIKEMQRFAGLKDTGRLDSDTLKLMSTPRCSLPDIIGFEDLLKKRRRKRRYSTVGLHWKKSDLTWSIQNYPSLRPSLEPNVVHPIITYAFKAWSDVTNLKFQAASSKDRVDINISFARSLHEDGYPFDGKGGTLAHAFFPGEYELAGDTHFDDEESWTYGGDDHGTDLFSVAVHEFGHALGLAHSSSSPSIMRPYYQGAVASDITTYILPDDDRYGIQSIYGVKTGSPTPSPNKPTPHLPKPPKPPSPKVPLKPDPTAQNRCEGSFDAIANIRGDVFFFKGPYFWRIQRSGSLVSFQPALIKNFWTGLPPGTDKIDAVYERKVDNRIIFFIGSQYWVFQDTVAMSENPHPLSDWGLISRDGKDVKRVDAAFVWAHNGKTYIFSGGEFWRFDEGPGKAQSHRQDRDYPRQSSLWKDVPIDPDDIITWGQGETYFFKDNSYWVLKRGELGQDSVRLGSTAVDWMKCPEPNPTKHPDNPCQKDCYCNGGLQMSASSWLLSVIILLYPSIGLQ